MSMNVEIMTGNEACAQGAVYAGMRFFAGYPITPATEIAETASALLPKVGGKFMQMEDELASIAAIIGASMAGTKSMTATSGAGFSLMQENLGFGIIAEIPCVIVNVSRQGPCQGVATVPSQGDIMQTRWGTHGDHPAIVIAPASVPEMYFETIRAFNLAEYYRTPVIMLSDAMLAHMSEKVNVPAAGEVKVVNRKLATTPLDQKFKPYEDDGTGIPPMANYGDGHIWYVTGIVHDETGFPATGNPEKINAQVKRICNKVENNRDDIEKYEEYMAEDADYLIVSIGLVSRSVRTAVDQARAEGVKVGLFRPITVWPFPERRLAKLAAKAKVVISCEMNEGQLGEVIRQVVGKDTRVSLITQNNGKLISVETVLTALREAQQ